MTSATGETYPYSYRPTERAAHEGVLPITCLTMQEIRAKIAPIRFGLAAKEIVKSLGIAGEDKVLELGSGLGLLGEKIQERVRSAQLQYCGIDLNFSSARATAERGLPSICGDISKLPFMDESFDHIVTTDVLEHVSNPDSVVREMYRVLKPGGRVFAVIADPSEGRFDKVADHLKRTDGSTDVTYWENLFREHGFEVDITSSQKYRQADWRRILNFPLVAKLKDYPGFACAFNPVNRPGVYILQKPVGEFV